MIEEIQVNGVSQRLMIEGAKLATKKKRRTIYASAYKFPYYSLSYHFTVRLYSFIS